MTLIAYIIPGLKTMDDLIADAFSVSISEIHTTDRKGHGKDARFFAMWYLKKNTPMSFSEIGNRYKRDHSTVFFACKKVDIWMENDKIFSAKANRALTGLKNLNIK